MDNWQPIETAPKDGSLILCWVNYSQCHTMELRWDEEEKKWMECLSYTEHEPSHWRTLLEPPTTPPMEAENG